MSLGFNTKALEKRRDYLPKNVVWRLGGTWSQKVVFTRDMLRNVLTKTHAIYVVNMNDSYLSQMMILSWMRRLVKAKRIDIEMGNETYITSRKGFKGTVEQNRLEGQRQAKAYIEEVEKYLSYFKLVMGTYGRDVIVQVAYLRHLSPKAKAFRQGWNSVVEPFAVENAYSISVHIYDGLDEALPTYEHLDELIAKAPKIYVTECGCLPQETDRPKGIKRENFIQRTEAIWKGVKQRLRGEDLLCVQISHQDQSPIGLYKNGEPTDLYPIFKSL